MATTQEAQPITGVESITEPRELAQYIPKVTDYYDGNKSGETTAIAFMKYLATGEAFPGGTLQRIVFDIAEASENDSTHGTRGHIVGMFALLERYLKLVACSPNYKQQFDEISLEELVDRCRDAEEGGPRKRCDEKEKARRSKQARHAANCRWEKHRRTLEAQSI